MTVAHWLEANAPGFRDLSPQEREALAHFCLLWSLFEYEALGGYGDVPAIYRSVARCVDAGVLTAQTFSDGLAYFRARYFSQGTFTPRFQHLHLERPRDPPVVREVLSGQSENPRDVAAAVLIIVFRFRNNLLHGAKWVYELREQDQNFANANAILTRAIDLNRGLPMEPARDG